MSLGRQWPLSSVGIKDVGDINVDDFVGEPSLRQMYVDRIIERGDLSRLSDGRVRQAVQAAIWAVPESVRENL